MVVLSPLLDLANFYSPPFTIQLETSVEVTTHDRTLTIRGNLDILVICNQILILTIESKQAAVSLETGRAQLLSYILANSNQEQPSFGLLTNGSSCRFVKLALTQHTRGIAPSPSFIRANPQRGSGNPAPTPAILPDPPVGGVVPAPSFVPAPSYATVWKIN